MIEQKHKRLNMVKKCVYQMIISEIGIIDKETML